jgi:hypothetical protein
MNATKGAEMVLGYHRSKLVGTKMLATRQKSEILGRHSEMEDPLLRADGAVALRDALDNRVDLESDAATVTTPDVARHLGAPQR